MNNSPAMLNDTYVASLRRYSALARSAMDIDEAPIVSIFGLHLLLALYGNDLKGPADRSELSEVLGSDLEVLQRAAQTLISSPHDAVKLAAEAWANLPVAHMSTKTKPVPSQDALDRWASDNTMGMIERFPLDVNPQDVAILLASAIAVKTGWHKEFKKLPDGRLFAWDTNARVLGVLDTEAAGPVVVFAPRDQHDVDVVSIAAAEDVAPAAVWRAVDEVLDRGTLQTLDFMDVEEDGHSWTVGTAMMESDYPGKARSNVTVPAWSRAERYQFDAAPGLQPFVGPYEGVQCAQNAFGEYTATGFSAAAVTAIMIMRGMMMAKRRELVKVVSFDLDKPHALVAVVRAPETAWDNVRIFEAWVTP